MRHLPVYITEADEDVAWDDRPNDWIQRAHREIEAWNAGPGQQQIRALILYRWSRDDKWCLQDKGHVLKDFRQAVAMGMRWRESAVAAPPPPPAWRPGDTLTVQANVKLRRTPGYLEKAESDVLEVVAPGAVLTLLIGAQREVDGLRWWPLRRAVGAGAAGGEAVGGIGSGDEGAAVVVEGWMAEASRTGTPLLAKVADAPTFTAGEQVSNITASNVNLRAAPGGRCWRQCSAVARWR